MINLIAEETIEHAMLEALANKMTLAEGVLDGTESSLASAKLKRGRDANLARLQQFLSIAPADKSTDHNAPPTDPALAFAGRAADALGKSLVHCQEAILPGDATPVLLAVLRDPSRASVVSSLFHETDWRGSAPKLQVIDESTWQTIQQLAASGFITLNTRATRHPNPPSPPSNSNASPTSAPSPPKSKRSPNSSSKPTLPKKPNHTRKPRRKPGQSHRRFDSLTGNHISVLCSE